MEFTFLASYVVMLIGFLIMDKPEYEKIVKLFLKDRTFSIMVEILKKFFSFMNLTASVSFTCSVNSLIYLFDMFLLFIQTEASSVTAMKATEKVIKYLEECDKPQPLQAQINPYLEGMDLRYSISQ